MSANPCCQSFTEFTSKYWCCTTTLVVIVMYVVFIGKVTSDIRRYNGGYDADFRVINKGRLYPTMMYFKNIDYHECSLHCIKHLRCVSFNFNFDTKECELAEDDFDEYEADTNALYWLNFGTSQRIDGGFSDWLNGSCSAKCGGGVRNQFRTCTNPEPKFGGEECIGKMSRTIVCNNHPCPINGGLSDWISDSCSATCGGGQLTQTKTCTNPVPQHGGADCIGDRRRTLTCNPQPCPIHGGFTNWVSFGTCSATCDRGTKGAKRTCTQPRPQHGGNDCIGETSKRVECLVKHCPINGQWTQWTPTSSCSKACEGGQLTQGRYCTDPSPQYGGADCVGENTRTASCNTHCCSGRHTTKGTCCLFSFKIGWVTWEKCDFFNQCKDVHGNMEQCA